jgi:hypothetical protein
MTKGEVTQQVQARLLQAPTSQPEQDDQKGEEETQWRPEVIMSCTQRSSTREVQLQEYRAALRKEQAKCKAEAKAMGQEVLALAERISSLAGVFLSFSSFSLSFLFSSSFFLSLSIDRR